MNIIREVSNLTTKKTLAIVKSYFKSQEITCDFIGNVWTGVQNGKLDFGVLIYMQTFNIWGNTGQSEFETFFKVVVDFLELDGTGAHYCRHIYGTEELVGAST